jgi:signal transduction histidine kinase
VDLAVRGGLTLRRRGFWAGWGGISTTIAIGGLVVALLVGWVLLWVNRPEGPSIVLLVLGCIAFTVVLIGLATLQNRLHAHWRLRQMEATLLTGVSHNMRTPVAAIRAAAQALGQEDLAEEQRVLLREAIVQETRRLGLRIDNVMETGRLEVETRGTAQIPVAFNELVQQCTEAAQGVIRLRGGSLEVDLEEGMSVRGEPGSLHLMLDNLLDNALTYAEDAPQITVTMRRHGEHAHLVITDQGIGFDPAEKARLFRRFQRGDTGRHGSGLGLTLSRAIARGHGGDLHLHSDGVGRGAEAEVWLPLVEV